MFRPFKLFLFIIGSLSAFLSGCEDDCNSKLFYLNYEPIYLTSDSVRNSFAIKEPQVLSYPGKIYLLGDYLFINELGQGIHIIDNSNNENPKNIGFINIMGNFDMAAKGNILYADNYADLLAIDISNLSDIKIAKRIEGVFEEYYYFDYISDVGEAMILTYNQVPDTVWYDDPDCGGVMPTFLKGGGGPDIAFGGMAMEDMSAVNSAVLPPSVSTAGVGGSMARFTIVNDNLYTVGSYTLRNFDISNLIEPQQLNTIDIGWGIETIFPYKNNLFIGAQNGMHIYDISNRNDPKYMSTFAHVTSCDPVVVNDTIAYVTLRSGNECQGFTNQLDIIDIKNLYNPQLIVTYQMQNPHGLGIDGDALFICEGMYGLKIFNASDIYTIDENLIHHYTEMDAFDVIPYNNTLMMIGQDGLYQYDYTDLDDIKFLSQIDIVRTGN